MKLSSDRTWPLVRFIAPAFPEVNIFSNSKIPPLGLVSVATAANRVWGWRVEVIDENNYRGPRAANGLPDHELLQKENPALVTGFYCGLSSTMERIFELSRFYRDHGTVNIAGGWHAHYCPDEVLDNSFDVVVHGDGEIAIQQILAALKSNGKLAGIPGISFWGDNRRIVRNPPTMLELPDLSELPYPDFGLIRYLRRITTYPIGRVRGCRMNCEFCSVKGKPRWAAPQHVFNLVNWLVETRNARSFFIVDDRLEENPEGILEFFRMIHERYGDRLHFTVQVRLETAKNVEFLETMKKAGVRTVCVGYESPIDEDLKAMRKGYSSRHMVERTRILRRYFWVHGMFIFGYPSEQRSEITVSEMTRRFKGFIRGAKISSIQVLHPMPLVGTDLRARLEKEGRIFPRDLVPWSKYDGNYACFMPENMSLKEFQDTPIKLMKWFYSWFSFLKIPFRTIAFPVHYLVAGWRHWHYSWLKEVVRYSGHRLVRKWKKRQAGRVFLSRLESYKTSVSGAK